MKIVFATNNKNKLAEIREILGGDMEVLSLGDIDCHDDIPETGDTLEENAMQKAEYIYKRYGLSVFADDTGLEVDALGGELGVYSARYAGGHGWYTGHATKVIVLLAKKSESVEIFRLIKMIDPDAFVSQSSVIGVYGEGFDSIKVRVKLKPRDKGISHITHTGTIYEGKES